MHASLTGFNPRQLKALELKSTQLTQLSMQNLLLCWPDLCSLYFELKWAQIRLSLLKNFNFAPKFHPNGGFLGCGFCDRKKIFQQGKIYGEGAH